MTVYLKAQVEVLPSHLSQLSFNKEEKMYYHGGFLLLLLTILVMVAAVSPSRVRIREENGVKVGTYLSPKFVMGAGMVLKRFYHNVDFPRGHIAVKDFLGEVVDKLGNPVPLSETYLHHWVVTPYYALLDDSGEQELKVLPIDNDGVCDTVRHYFGSGAETRSTPSYVPDPYAIELGNPAHIPEGYVLRYYFNMHALDLRGVADEWLCQECRCDHFNITVDENNQPLTADYPGGFLCCYDNTQCRLKEGFKSIQRDLYFRYTVKWIDWDDTIIPVKIYRLDIADNGERAAKSLRSSVYDEGKSEDALVARRTGCKEEYDVHPCGNSSHPCVHIKKTTIIIPKGGYVIHGSNHIHSEGIGATLYGADGRELCTSVPIYGHGNAPGNEKDYVVGVTACYPEIGSVKIYDGEGIVFESNYSGNKFTTGVMGIFFILIADYLPVEHNKPIDTMVVLSREITEHMVFPNYSWALVFVGAAITLAVGISYRKKNGSEGYQPIP